MILYAPQSTPLPTRERSGKNHAKKICAAGADPLSLPVFALLLDRRPGHRLPAGGTQADRRHVRHSKGGRGLRKGGDQPALPQEGGVSLLLRPL